MKALLPLVALACLALLAPTAIAASEDLAAPAAGCAPNPAFSPFSDFGCCVFNTLRPVACAHELLG